MNLIIDAGNTRIKFAVFNNGEMIHNDVFSYEDYVSECLKLIEKFNCKNGIISSVKKLKKDEIFKIEAKINLFQLNSTSKIPFINSYGTPKTLGVDRIALVAAAVNKFKSKNTLIIDAGTCITYDFVDEKRVYYGGGISPGVLIRYKSLNNYTSKLPLLVPNFEVDLIGNSTETSIHSGIINGVVGELDYMIDQYKIKNKDLTVVLTGGDVNFLSNKLKNSIFANPNFLLEGLDAILTYNLK